MRNLRPHIALLAAALALGSTLHGQAQALYPYELHVGSMRPSFSGVNETDARAAFAVFVQRMGEKRGYALTPHLRIFDNPAALTAHLRQRPLDMLILGAWDYLALEPLPDYPLTFATAEQGRAEKPYLILVRKDSGITSLTGLAGKHVTVLRSSNSAAVRHWFRTEILALGRGAPEAFLERLAFKDQLSQTLLPVFFGKTDACVVDRQGFETMVELNPQLGETLQVLLESAPYVDTLVSVRLQGWERDGMRQDLIDAMLDISTDPAGHQLMALFKFNGFVPFEEHHLDPVRALRKRYDTYSGGLP